MLPVAVPGQVEPEVQVEDDRQPEAEAEADGDARSVGDRLHHVAQSPEQNVVVRNQKKDSLTRPADSVVSNEKASSFVRLLRYGVHFYRPVSDHVQTYIRQHYEDSKWEVSKRFLVIFFVGPLFALSFYFIQMPPLDEGIDLSTFMWYSILLTWYTAILSLPVFALWLANWMNDPSCRVKWFVFWMCIFPWFIGAQIMWLCFHVFKDSASEGLFPVPFGSVIIVCSVAGPMFMTGYFSFDKSVRSKKEFRWRYFWACSSIAACFSNLGVVIPFLMALLVRSSSGVVRMLVAGSMIMCREGLLTAIHWLAAKVNPDMSTGSCFHVVLFYQALIASLMQNNLDWYLVAFWVGMDALVNIFYICLALVPAPENDKNEAAAAGASTAHLANNVASVVPVGNSVASSRESSSKPPGVIEGIFRNDQTAVDSTTVFQRRQVEILLTLCTFEMAEVLGPLHYLLTSLLKRRFNPRMFEDITHIPDTDFDAGLQTLVLSFFLESFMFCVMVVVVRVRFQVNVLRLFYCVLKMHGWQLLGSQLCVMCFVLGMQQHAYYGMDFHLRFNWVGNDGDGTWGGARWIAGNCWQPPDVEEAVKCLG